MSKKFSRQKYLWSAIVLAGIGFVLNLFFSPPSTASLLLKYEDGGVRKFTGQVIEQMTIFDALVASSQEANFNNLLSVEGLSERIRIKLNDHPVPVGMIKQTTIKGGDLIEIELPKNEK